MANILYYKDELIIGYNKKAYFINLYTSVVTKSLTIPEKLLKADKEEVTEGNEKTLNKSTEKDLPPAIQHIDISPSGEFLAVTLSGQKYLLLYKVCSQSLELQSLRRLSRVSSALSFSGDSTKLLVCDKTGDCYLFDCIDFNSSGKWILGHLSIVMDVIFSPGEKYILTCDRDEKIRVTNYPECHEIERYCLGHTEYVSSIKLLPFDPNTYLLSLSGDNRMKIWEYKTGKKLHEIEIPAPGVKISLQEISDTVCNVAVLLYQPRDNVLIYEIKYSCEKFESELLSTHCYDPAIVTTLCYGGSNLYLGLARDSRLSLEVIGKTNNSSSLKKIVEELFKEDEVTELEDISLWFKKKFDNVSDYLERKKRRIEEKSSR